MANLQKQEGTKETHRGGINNARLTNVTPILYLLCHNMRCRPTLWKLESSSKLVYNCMTKGTFTFIWLGLFEHRRSGYNMSNMSIPLQEGAIVTHLGGRTPKTIRIDIKVLPYVPAITDSRTRIRSTAPLQLERIIILGIVWLTSRGWWSSRPHHEPWSSDRGLLTESLPLSVCSQ